MLIFLFLSIGIKIQKEEVLVKNIYSDWWIVPTVTGDGRWVLFNGKFNKKYKDEIWAYDLESKSLKKIIDTDNESTAPFFDAYNRELFFYGYCKESGSYELYKYSFRNNKGWRLTDNEEYDGFPRTDLNGHNYVVHQMRYLEENILILSFKRGDSIINAKIYPPSSIDEAMHPAFDPEGERIAFAFEGYSSGHGIFIYDIKTKKLTKLIEGEDAFLYSPCFSPDGRYLLFLNDEEDDIYIIDIETGEYKRLTGKGDYAFAWWSPKGNEIITLRFGGEGDNTKFKLVKIILQGKDVPHFSRIGKLTGTYDIKKINSPIIMRLARVPLIDEKYQLGWEAYIDPDFTESGGITEEINSREIEGKPEYISKINKIKRRIIGRLPGYLAVFIAAGIIMGIYFIIRRFS